MIDLYNGSNALILDALGAVVVHGIYKKFEIEPGRKLPTSLLLFGVPSIATYLLSFSYGSFTKAFLLSFGVFFSTLITSIISYRVSPFHPLAKYPGPLLAKITKIQGMRMMATGKNHLYYKELHAQYGPYVRVGPNELSIVDAKHLTDILGGNGLPRGPLWDGRRNPFTPRNLIAIRDQQEHARRRKPWNRAFSTTAVKDLEPMVQKRAFQLMRELERCANGGKEVNLAEWTQAFAYDVMGDMVFGGGFETMRDGAKNSVIMHVIESGLKLVACIQTIPWIMSLVFQLPGASKSIFQLREFAYGTVQRRREEGSQTKDVYYYLMDEDKILPEKERMSQAEAVSDAIMAIVTGYDTTATVLGGILYYTIRNRDVCSRLREEVDEHFQRAEGNSLESSKLGELPYLNAVINESLRLAHPVDVMQRGTTDETGGRWLGSNYIPKNTAIDIPIYTLFRDPRYFAVAPEEFRPGRFLDVDGKSEAGTNLSAFIPFSFGPENCAGRNLATIELRVVTALMIRHFDMEFAEGYDKDEWPKVIEDYYVMKVGRLPVVLKSRASVLE